MRINRQKLLDMVNTPLDSDKAAHAQKIID